MLFRSQIHITAVSYLNTIPFIYGIEHSGLLKNAKLHLEYPANCAKMLSNGNANIGLIPVGGLSQLKDFKIVSNYCIGAIGKVYSVGLFSKVPLSEIKQIYLDNESLTSVRLVKVLAKKFWGISPEWVPFSQQNEMNYFDYESIVLIGDKTFGLEKNFTFVYDLAEQWNIYTKLPFVFAVWVAKKDVLNEQLEKFNLALKWGVEHVEEAVGHYPIQVEKNFAIEYLTQNISYPFDDLKKEGLKLFAENIADARLNH